ncbi:MAG: cation transporting ATPase C-terminal domain-containing protein, partial [Chromatiaceae bacterium]|nr:cation transporting ATPase C-terminal domain-containing protein [Chromatiaceae bacterium]
LLGLAVELGLLVFIVFTAPGNWVFGTQAFEPGLWGIIDLLALAFGILEETRKCSVRRWARPQPDA